MNCTSETPGFAPHDARVGFTALVVVWTLAGCFGKPMPRPEDAATLISGRIPVETAGPDDSAAQGLPPQPEDWFEEVAAAAGVEFAYKN
ncbi:MAG: hypothetical protein EXS05_20800 [Planctomycetaceae bacterium]|nr:hypothetical protein [Planctomycetaceae bacterium]